MFHKEILKYIRLTFFVTMMIKISKNWQWNYHHSFFYIGQDKFAIDFIQANSLSKSKTAWKFKVNRKKLQPQLKIFHCTTDGVAVSVFGMTVHLQQDESVHLKNRHNKTLMQILIDVRSLMQMCCVDIWFYQQLTCLKFENLMSETQQRCDNIHVIIPMPVIVSESWVNVVVS